ncbi:SpaA isopeptide-forming pilin-related protein [Pseudoscardovia suis]|uniref:Cell surface protein n=1 Tax=Pseudoscardovia suis TaxID=987063 RepID=A0A261EYF3_9BIFI|nr:SpaA isopeptide-forming pilin-related protein [Pseudoscardovia suis]OZG51902.1 hypothetical protein PSSU_0685 [Pseudoscardovia suis]PJJ69500.1 LPXTG-motif cell wall-anchored protein [Pseudoscardovia suis]
MSVTTNKSRGTLLAAIAAIVAMVAAVLLPATLANAATTGSITLESSSSLKDRTFEAWEPIRITGTSSNGALNSNGTLNVDISDAYLPYVRTAAEGLPITSSSDSATISSTSSEDDVIAAISLLAQNQESLSDTDAHNFANKLYKALVDNNVAASKTDTDFSHETDGSRKLSGIEYGWYLIAETTNPDTAAPSRTVDNSPLSLVITKPIAGDVTVNVKSSTPVSHKNIVDAPTSGDLSSKDYTNQRKAAIVNENTPIHYQLTFHIPSDWTTNFQDNGFWFTMNDTLDSSLVYEKTDAIEVGTDFATTTDDTAFSEKNSLYDMELEPQLKQTDPSTGATSLVWQFGSNTTTSDAYKNNKTNLNLAGKWVKLYYTAHLSQDAPINTAIGNEYDVTYQHNPNAAADGEKTPAEHPYVYTYNLVANKQDGNTDDPLEGVEFAMYSDSKCTDASLLRFTKNEASDGTTTYEYDPNGKETVLSTNSKGAINVEGLAASSTGTAYYLKETKTKDGYRLSNATITATLKVAQKSDSSKPFSEQKKEETTDWTTQDGQKQTLVYELTATGDHSSASDSVLLVKNYRGVLPTTGAQGIALLCVVGVMFIAGGVLLLRKHR